MQRMVATVLSGSVASPALASCRHSRCIVRTGLAYNTRRCRRAAQQACEASNDANTPSESQTQASAELPASPTLKSRARLDHALKSWKWRGHTVKYTTAGCGKPVVLLHGFGASSKHWRFNIPALASAGYKVYAIDLLGFGASDKPELAYTMEQWQQLVCDFIDEFMAGQRPMLVGNSLGSLVCLMVAAEKADSVAGTALINVAGGMNNKAIADDWRIQLAMPIFLLIDWLLSQPKIARSLFDRFRTPDNIRSVLVGVYPSSVESVDDELVDIIHIPSNDLGALEAFVSIITGPPGPRPEQLVPRFEGPLLLLWGDKDNFTPMDGPVGRYFQALPDSRPNTQFIKLPGVGHCPHDEDPDLTHSHLLPWLESNFS